MKYKLFFLILIALGLSLLRCTSAKKTSSSSSSGGGTETTNSSSSEEQNLEVTVDLLQDLFITEYQKGMERIRFSPETEFVLTLPEEKVSSTTNAGGVKSSFPKTIKFPTSILGKFSAEKLPGRPFQKRDKPITTWEHEDDPELKKLFHLYYKKKIALPSLQFIFHPGTGGLRLKEHGWDEATGKAFVLYAGAKYLLPENYGTIKFRVAKESDSGSRTVKGVEKPGPK